MRTKQSLPARRTPATTSLSFKTLMLFLLFTILIANVLPHNASAASIGLSVSTPKPGNHSITISWDSAPNVKYYAYSVRDTTTNESIKDRAQTSKLYAKVSHTWEDGHSYRVWAGAYCEGNDPDNTSSWDYSGMTTFTVVGCKHTSTDIGWDTSKSITYISVSDTQHKMKGYQYEYCTECFEHIGSSFKATETVKHNFDENGDCPYCGYTQGCSHDRTKLVAIDGYPAYKQDSETEHIVDIQYKRVCKDCDAVVSKLVDSERVYERESHSFNSKGVCSDCGYVKPSKQEALKVSVSASPSSAETGATLSASATASGGDGDYSFSWKVTCDGNVVANTDLSYGRSYTYTTSKAGSYVFTATARDGNGSQTSASSGTITVKAPACQHPSTEIAWDTSRAISYKSVSDQTHTMTGYQYKYCTVCFEHIGASFSASETVKHNFDSNGDCPSCGYTHACQHTRTDLVIISGYPAYTPDSETQHVVDIQYKKVCIDCDAVVSKLVDSARVHTRENHTFNESGACILCGYVKPANQTPLKISVSASPSNAETGATLSASATASGGDGNYSFSWKVTCDGNVVANTDLSFGSYYSYTAKKVGNYVFTATVRDGNGSQTSASSGTITVKAPAHVHNYEEKILSRGNYVNQDEEGHDVTITYILKCDGCGDESARKTKTVRVAHSYTSKGHIDSTHQSEGHATFDRCACDAVKYTGYKEYSNCCTCNGHAWGEAYLQGEQWLQKCARCGKTKVVAAPLEVDTTCKHEWFIKDDSGYKTHPHTILFGCKLCNATKTENTKALMCCACGNGEHSWVITTPMQQHTHPVSYKCSKCQEYMRKEPDYDEHCITCNPNHFDWSKLATSSDISATANEYNALRKTDDFKEKYLYAPNGGVWVSDAKTYSNGYTTAIPSSTHADYYAMYITPEEVETLYFYMKHRTNEVARDALESWMSAAVGDSIESSLELMGKIKGSDKVMKSLNIIKDAQEKIDHSREVVKLISEEYIFMDNSVKITDERMKELESIIAHFPSRDSDSSDVEKDAMFVADFVGIFNQTLGKTLAFYDFFTSVDYASITGSLKDAKEHGNGIIITRQISWETRGNTLIRDVKYWPATTIKEWDCSNGYYMNDDYSLYGSYHPY